MPNFQRRHYRELATVLRETDPRYYVQGRTAEQQFKQVVDRFIALLADDNKAFNSVAFKAAVDGSFRTKL